MKDETYNFLVIEKNGKTELKNLSSPYRSLEDLARDRSPCSFKILVKREGFLERLMRSIFTNEDFIVTTEDMKNFSSKDVLQRVQNNIGFKIIPLSVGCTFSYLNKEGRNAYLNINGLCLSKIEDEEEWGDAHINSGKFFSEEQILDAIKNNVKKSNKRHRTTMTPELRRAVKRMLKKHPDESISKITQRVNNKFGTTMTSFPVMTIAKEIRKK